LAGINNLDDMRVPLLSPLLIPLWRSHDAAYRQKLNPTAAEILSERLSISMLVKRLTD
jgi:hypothetical protein